jgi:hypothetical protein
MRNLAKVKIAGAIPASRLPLQDKESLGGILTSEDKTTIYGSEEVATSKRGKINTSLYC